MTISKKNGYLLAAITASLSMSNVSAGNNNVKEFSPTAKFFSAENRNYSIDCELEENFLASKSGR